MNVMLFALEGTGFNKEITVKWKNRGHIVPTSMFHRSAGVWAHDSGEGERVSLPDEYRRF
jgi:hypothetical protein